MKTNQVLLVLMAAVLAACSKTSKPTSSVTQVKGNPFAFVEKAQMNGNAVLPAGLFKEGTEWAVYISGYSEGPRKNGNLVVAEQTPDTSQTAPPETKFKPHILSRKDGGWELIVPGGKDTVGLRFDPTPGGFEVSDLLSGSNVITEYNILHTSASFELDAFSVLVHDSRPGSREVLSVNFYRHGPDTDRSSSDPFIYLFGKGYKIGWDTSRALELKVCGNVPKILQDQVATAVQKWNTALGTGLDFVAKNQPACPPFSDLRTRTYNFIDGWVELIDGTGVLFGHAKVLPNFISGFLMDSDIMILMNEFGKMAPGHSIYADYVLENAEMAYQFQDTATHEIGHMLGLDHQFDPKIPSIMSYSDNSKGELSDYDKRAIQALYPARNLVQRFLGLF